MRTRDQKRFNCIGYIVMTLVTLIAFLPFALVFLSSVTEESTLVINGYSFFPEKLSIYAYTYIMANGAEIFRAYGVTILVTAAGTAINICMSTMLAYPLSMKKLPCRRFFTYFVLITLLFNGGLVPTYLLYTNYLHIKNTIWALIIPNLMLHPMNVLLMRTYFAANIPVELLEAAEVDGAGQFRTFMTIVVPLGKPIIITMGLFSGLTYWNDWTNGLYYLTGRSGEKLYSIQNYLNKVVADIQYLSSSSVANASEQLAKLPTVSIRMAIAFIAMLPILVLFPFLQRYFIGGITQGAVKG